MDRCLSLMKDTKLGEILDTIKSIHFVEKNGSDVERARLRYILYAADPDPEILQPFLDLQNRDGGFPCNRVKDNLSSINDTLNALWWMDELGMLSSPSTENAIDYLLGMQLEDGGWDEDPRIPQKDLPQWIDPGNLVTQHYLSAYSAYWLIMKGHHSSNAVLMALDYLDAQFQEKTLFKGFHHTTWIASSVFLMAGEAYTEAAMVGLQNLLRRKSSDWQNSQLAWALDCLGNADLPRDHPFIQTGIKVLVRRQAPNGSWSSKEGEASAVNGTIAVLKVFKRYPPV
jgi:squalene cyclase